MKPRKSTFPTSLASTTHRETLPGVHSKRARSTSDRFLSDLRPLLLLGLAVSLLHVLTNGRPGLHRDELDILVNAQHLAWGYVAYPPLTPFLARIAYELFGLSLTGLRLLPALAQGAAVVLAGCMAGDIAAATGLERDAARRAMIVAALAAAFAPVALTTGMLLQYMSFDFLWWVLLAFFIVRLLRTEDPRWWLGIGAAIGLGMMTKYTIVFFIAGLAAGVLLTGARRYLRSPWLWAGAGLALLIYLPNLIWQIQNGFISLEFLSSIHARDIEWGRAEGYLPEQLYAAANPFTLPLWIAGLLFCLFHREGRRFRLLAILYLVTFTLLLVNQARSYYLAPAYPMLLAAGAVWFEGWFARLSRSAARFARGAQWGLLAAGALMGIALIKPIAPINSPLWNFATDISDVPLEMVGWPDLVDQVAQVAERIPAEERDRAAILAGNYGEAGALILYGQDRALPPVISGSNSMWERGYGSPPPETVILVGFDRGYANRFFSDCQQAGQVSNRYGVMNEESTYHTALFICRQTRRPWAEMWPTMRWFQ